MKAITNTSPFLLLLVPVFMMIVFTLFINADQKTGNDVVSKNTPVSNSMIKQATLLFK